MDDSRLVTPIADAVLAGYARRRPAQTTTDAEKKANEHALVGALHAFFWRRFWLAGALKAAGDALNVTSPLVTNELLKFLAAAYVHAHAPEVLPDAPRVGKGIALAFGLALMQRAWRCVSWVALTRAQWSRPYARTTTSSGSWARACSCAPACVPRPGLVEADPRSCRRWCSARACACRAARASRTPGARSRP